jgi:hypothetical protein
MRIVLVPLLLTALAAGAGCRGGGGAGGDGDVRVQVRLQNEDPHLYDVATVDLDLRRDNVVIQEHLTAPAGQVLSFPTELILKVPIGAGPLTVDAIARAGNGAEMGGGQGQVTVTAGAIAALTIQLLSDRNRATRGHPGVGGDGGAEDAGLADKDGPLAADTGVPPPPDAALPPPPDAAGPCSPHSYRLTPVVVVSVDYGSLPRDSEDTRVAVSAGYAHEHIHDFVGWMRFDLRGVPDRAVLTAMKVALVLIRPPTNIPQLALVYSTNDQWQAGELTSNTAESVPRTARVSGDLGPPRPARALYAADPARYAPYWPADLQDNALTLGITATNPPDSPEAWADFHGLGDPLLAPVLELETCE